MTADAQVSAPDAVVAHRPHRLGWGRSSVRNASPAPGPYQPKHAVEPVPPADPEPESEIDAPPAEDDLARREPGSQVCEADPAAPQGQARRRLGRRHRAKEGEPAVAGPGALAEVAAQREVAAQLGELGPAWRALHAVPLGEPDGPIDHLLIGPAGVFVIDARSHTECRVSVAGDSLKVNGRFQPHIRDSRVKARRAAEVLGTTTEGDVDVRAVVAVVGCAEVQLKEQPKDGVVTVVEVGSLNQFVRGLKPTLDEATADQIYAAARRASNWRN